MKGPFKFVCIFLAIIIILVFGVWFLLDIHASARLVELLGEIEESHATMEDLVPPPVPDEENAAITYNEAFALRDRIWGGDITREESNGMSAVLSNGWSEEHAQNVMSLLEKNKEVLKLLHQASKRKACRFDIAYEKGPSMLLPHLGKLQECSRLLVLEALAKHQQDDLQGAFESCNTCFRAAHAVSNEPILISRLVHVAMEYMGINALQRIADDERCKEDMYRSILEEMMRLEGSDPGLKFVFEGEQCLFGVSVYNAIMKDPTVIRDFGVQVPQFIGALGHVARPLIKNDEVCYLTLMKQFIEAIQLPCPEAERKLAAIENDITTNHRCVIAKTIMPALTRAYDKEISHQDSWRACEIGLALKIYQKQKGRLPDSLAELSPNILETLPKNPFTGKDFLYRQDNEGAGVYSDVGNSWDLWHVKRRRPAKR